MAIPGKTTARALDLRLLLRQFVNTAAQSSQRTPIRSASKLRSCFRPATTESFAAIVRCTQVGHRIRAAKHTNSQLPVHCGFFPRRLSVDPTFDEGCLREDRCSDQKVKISGPRPARLELPEKAPVPEIPGMRAAGRTPPTSSAKIFPTWMQNIPPDPIPNHPT